ncbi:ABC transporter substrate-binding protein [Trujillonella endophytica]|uniref:ABC transporter substrate-binding protein n=1 Tax=Trujillonella endophytica TaxID=673521 RepID=UPI003D180FFC
MASVALIALAACSSDDDDSGDDGGSGGGDNASGVAIYGTDGNMGSALGDQFEGEDGSLDGMDGTLPLTELSSDFQDRLLEVDPDLIDFNYAAETYDAVVITALAAQLAGTNDANVFKAYVNGVTFGGEKCTDWASCIEIVNAGGNPDYDGFSGPLAFTDAGEPSYASFGLVGFESDNTIDPENNEYVFAGDESNAASDEGPPPAPPGTTGGPLVMGYLLPETGDLAFLGPPEIAAFDLAIQDINEAGGVLGVPIDRQGGDSGDASTDTATQTVDRLIGQGVNAIVGAASSTVSLNVLDRIVSAGVMMISPANTSDQFTTYPDNGLYFRTAPPDVLQAQALASLVAGEGPNVVGILARNDAYGNGLAENTAANLIAGGLSEDNVEVVIYDPTAANFDAEVGQMVELEPDAVIIIGFDESARIIDGLNENGIGPQR